MGPRFRPKKKSRRKSKRAQSRVGACGVCRGDSQTAKQEPEKKYFIIYTH